MNPVIDAADRARVGQILLAVARAHALDSNGMAASEKQSLHETFAIEPIDLEPRVFFRITDNWLERTVRFLFDTHQSRGAKHALGRRIVDALDEEGIGIASAADDIVGFPQIECKGAPPVAAARSRALPHASRCPPRCPASGRGAMLPAVFAGEPTLRTRNPPNGLVVERRLISTEITHSALGMPGER